MKKLNRILLRLAFWLAFLCVFWVRGQSFDFPSSLGSQGIASEHDCQMLRALTDIESGYACFHVYFSKSEVISALKRIAKAKNLPVGNEIKVYDATFISINGITFGVRKSDDSNMYVVFMAELE